MELCYYYQILDMGIVYEKGGLSGKLWKPGEQKRLREELLFWRELIAYVSMEEDGIDCTDRVFGHIEQMCRKYRLPNYERILQYREKITNDQCIVEVDYAVKLKINKLMLRLIGDAENYVNRFNGKTIVHRILCMLHNFPKVMHGSTILNENCRPISYKDACDYARGYMNDRLRGVDCIFDAQPRAEEICR